VYMNKKKALWVALSDIPGVGKKTAQDACQKLGYLPTCPWGKLTEKQQRRLQLWLEEQAFQEKAKLFGTDFRRKNQKEKEALISLGSNRGIRLRKGLPVRGQRTHSNGRTARRRLG